MKRWVSALLFSLILMAFGSAAALPLHNQSMTVGGHSVVLQVPEGLRLEFVAAMSAPRFISKGPDGELLIGSRSATIYRVKYPYRSVETLVSIGSFIHSTVYRQGLLYAADTHAVYSAPYAGDATQVSAGDFNEVTPLPSDTGGHSSRTIILGPDSNLYVGLGISGNCTDDEYLGNAYSFEKQRGGVFLLDPSNNLSPFSSGLRNPIGLAFHPQTGDLYATNAGPDNLGYDQPPEVLAKLSSGSFHGMPWFQYYAGSFKSGECASTTSPRPVSEAVTPAALFLPRSTPEGIAFLHETNLGSQFAASAAVAIHGSWATMPDQGIASRRHPKIVLVDFTGGVAGDVDDLITGFQRADGSRFARPCGVAVGSDGNIYFTSDGGEVEGLFRLVRETSTRTGPIPSVYNLLLKNN